MHAWFKLLENSKCDQDAGPIDKWVTHYKRPVKSSIGDATKEHSSKHLKGSGDKNELMGNPKRERLRDDSHQN